MIHFAIRRNNVNEENLMAIYIENDHPENECLTVSVTDAAQIWGFSPQTVYNAIKSGAIKAIRISEKRMRISKKEVERVLKGDV